MSTTVSHMIKQRVKPSDIFITPLPIAQKQIKNTHDIYKKLTMGRPAFWLDPCMNSGRYYYNYPEYCEKMGFDIDKDVDYKDCLKIDFLSDWDKNTNNPCKQPDIICSNPPFSVIDKWLAKSCSLKPTVISYVMAVHGITTKRLEFMNKSGYYLHSMELCKVQEWYGMTAVMIWCQYHTEGPKHPDCISYDRKVYYSKK